MPYRIWFDGPTLLIALSGTLAASDLHEMGDEILAIENGGTNTPHRLIDMSQIEEAAVGYQEMAHLVDRSRVRPLNAAVRTALLVAQPVQLGYARMFQILNDHPLVTVRIFEEEASARAWLETGDADASRGK